MPKHRRILLVEGSGRGFLTQYSHALASGLSAAGHKVRLISGRRDELAGWRVSFEKRACLGAGPGGWANVARQVRAFRPDVVHLQWVDNPLAALALVAWLKRRAIACVYTPHNLLPHRWRWLSTPAYRALFHALDAVVARDEKIAWGLEEILTLPQRRIAYLPGSPNFMACPGKPRARLPELTNPGDDAFRVLFFGHGSGRKGLGDFLAALPGQRWPQGVHFIIAGEGVAHSVDEAALARAGETCRLSVINRYIAPQFVAELFENADLMVMPYVKLCKSPLLDLAAAFALPVLRSSRVEGANFIEGLHGLTLARPGARAMQDEIARLAGAPATLANMRARMRAGEPPAAAIARLALGHARLYARLPGAPANELAPALAPELARPLASLRQKA